MDLVYFRCPAEMLDVVTVVYQYLVEMLVSVLADLVRVMVQYHSAEMLGSVWVDSVTVLYLQSAEMSESGLLVASMTVLDHYPVQVLGSELDGLVKVGSVAGLSASTASKNRDFRTDSVVPLFEPLLFPQHNPRDLPFLGLPALFGYHHHPTVQGSSPLLVGHHLFSEEM